MSVFAYLHRACGGLGVYGDSQGAPGATPRCHYCDAELAPGDLVELHPAAEQIIAGALGFSPDQPPDSRVPAPTAVREALEEIVDRVRGAIRAAETPSARALAKALHASVQRALELRGLCTRGRS